MNPILDSDKAKVYYDGIFSNPRLQHPEGVALDDEGFVSVSYTHLTLPTKRIV